MEKSDHWHRLLRARHERPCRRTAEQRDELAPFHCLMLSRAFNGKDSTSRYGTRLLRCGISIQPMSQMGHSRRIDPLPMLAACPLRSDHVRTFAPQRFDAVCQEET
jgi:hypothetical protein